MSSGRNAFESPFAFRNEFRFHLASIAGRPKSFVPEEQTSSGGTSISAIGAKVDRGLALFLSARK
jgi:hypothetical protein